MIEILYQKEIDYSLNIILHLNFLLVIGGI